LGSGDAIAGAAVQLKREGQAPDSENPKAVTGADGKFTLSDVPPGRYRLYATRSGGPYVPVEYGQRTPTGEGIAFDLAAAQKMTGVQLAMSATSSISGRIYDEDGEPLGKAQVQALRSVYRDGRRVMTIVQSVETNDRGEYRLFWLAPGRYFVSAKPDIPQMPSDFARPESASMSIVHISDAERFGAYQQASTPIVTKRRLRTGEIIEETSVPVLFPGTLDAATARPIDLAPATNTGGVDFSVGAGRIATHHIRGRVFNADDGQPLPDVIIQAAPRGTEPLISIPLG
jgi:hypothetical protein